MANKSNRVTIAKLQTGLFVPAVAGQKALGDLKNDLREIISGGVTSNPAIKSLTMEWGDNSLIVTVNEKVTLAVPHANVAYVVFYE